MTGRGRQVLYGLVALAVGLLLAMVLSLPIITAQIRATQVDNTQKSDARDETLEIIKDCTQVGGRCYQRGERRTADVLASAQRIILISAACAVDLNPSDPVDVRVQQITSCVTDRLAAAQRRG